MSLYHRPKLLQIPLIRYWIVLIFLCGACQTAPPLPDSVWGDVTRISQVEQSSAPALWANPTRVIAAWVGADNTGVHHDARGWIDDKLSPVVVLPLPPVHPYAQSWIPASDDNLHLFWLDAASDGQTQLYSALINPLLTVERGPTAVSDALALRYSAISDVDGQARVAWSGGVLAEPTLNLQAIDDGGRPQLPQQIAVNADYPALVNAHDGTTLLFWLEEGQLMRAVLSRGAVLERIPLMNAVYLGAGDRLHSLNVGLDRTHANVFWNITRATGANESWFVSAALGATTASQPVLLSIATPDGDRFETGFNTGSADSTTSGEVLLQWASPLAGQYDVLPVAVQSPTGLGVVYLRDGIVMGYQEIVEDVRLIGEPTLIADRNRDLYLAWFDPSIEGGASMLMTTTKR